MKIINRVLLLMFFFLMIFTSGATATTIDLNDFFADPTVVVAGDGSSAIMSEDPGLTPVLLANDPGLGDPNVIIPGPGLALSFDYSFNEPAGSGEDDEFGVFILDAATGFSIGPAYEFFTQDTSSGNISFDLTGLVGMTLGLQFELSSLTIDAGFGSTLEISNLKIEEVSTIPEPSTILLLGLGLLGTAGISRKKLVS